MTPDADPARARQRLRALLGDVVPPPAPSGALLSREMREGCDIERWRLELATDEPAPALLVWPQGRAPRGVVLYHHAHGHRPEIGKEELLAGRPMLRDPPYGFALAQRGFASLAIDHRGFGERSAVPERMLVKRGLWEGVPLWGRRIADALAASAWLDTQAPLARLPRVALGFSMGGSLAWWSAALDERVNAVVDACCLAEFDTLLATGAYDLHAEYYFVPGVLREFSAASLNALILPRPHLSVVGRDDPLTPPEGVAAVDAALRAAARRAGVPTAWRQSVHAAVHEETRAMREEILAFVDAQAATP